VRGLTRDPTSAKSLALSAQGVELVQADLDSIPSLEKAFRGASAIFVNTDFFAHLFAPISNPSLLTSTSSKNANEYAYAREVEQNLNAAVAAFHVLGEDGLLERFVLSSLSDVRTLTKGKYTTVYHYDSKAEVVRVIHDKYPSLVDRMSLLNVGHYASNWKAFDTMAPQRQADGSFVMLRPFGKDVVLPYVDIERDLGTFVKVLVEDLPAGKELLGVSEMMTAARWMEIWGETMGVKTDFKRVSHDEFFAGTPVELKEEMADAFDYLEEFGYTGGDPNVLMPDQLGFSVPVTSMAEYIKGEDWSTVLKA
jgi:hypothetical protein